MKNNIIYTKGRTDEDGRIVIDGMFLEPDCVVDIAMTVSNNKFSVAVFPSEEIEENEGSDGCIFCPYYAREEE